MKELGATTAISCVSPSLLFCERNDRMTSPNSTVLPPRLQTLLRHPSLQRRLLKWRMAPRSRPGCSAPSTSPPGVCTCWGTGLLGQDNALLALILALTEAAGGIHATSVGRRYCIGVTAPTPGGEEDKACQPYYRLTGRRSVCQSLMIHHLTSPTRDDIDYILWGELERT